MEDELFWVEDVELFQVETVLLDDDEDERLVVAALFFQDPFDDDTLPRFFFQLPEPIAENMGFTLDELLRGVEDGVLCAFITTVVVDHLFAAFRFDKTAEAPLSVTQLTNSRGEKRIEYLFRARIDN